MKKVPLKRLRTLCCTAAFAVLVIGLAFHTGAGSLDAFGIGSIAAVCPVGQLEALVAGKNFNLHVALTLAVGVVLALFFGKAFCSWLCPSPHISRFFRPAASRRALQGKADDGVDAAGAKAAASDADDDAAVDGAEVLNAVGDVNFKMAASRGDASEANAVDAASGAVALASVGGKRDGLQIDTRHFALLGTLASAAVFGFPVFCLVCPVGLSIAIVVALWNMFQFAEVSWGIVLFPAILVLELVVCKRWCMSFCPLSALMSLAAQANVSARPRVDSHRCLRNSGVDCQTCVKVCPECVDPHSKRVPECSKCGDCIESCPARAISFKFPFLRGAGQTAKPTRPTKRQANHQTANRQMMGRWTVSRWATAKEGATEYKIGVPNAQMTNAQVTDDELSDESKRG